MILSKNRILSELNNSIFISPFDESKLNSNSYNLSLSERLLVYNTSTLDMKKKYDANDMTELFIPDEGFLLQPGKLYLASTVERTLTTKFIPKIEGRSSLARLGLFVHITAGLGEAGFDGHWTLELSCVQPIIIYPHISVCQIYYNTVEGDIALCNSDKYQYSTEAEPSKLFKEI